MTRLNDRSSEVQHLSKKAFDKLGLPKYATEVEVRRTYRALIRKVHPDKGGDEDTFKDIQESYNYLIQKFNEQSLNQHKKPTASTTLVKERDVKEDQLAKQTLREGQDQQQLILSSDLKELGDEAFEEGDYERAVQYYDAAIAYSRFDNLVNYAELLLFRSKAHQLIGNVTRAIDDAHRAAQLRPIWGQARVQLGCLLIERERWLEAKEHLHKAIQFLKEDSEERNTALISLREAERAIERESCLTFLEGHRAPISGIAIQPAVPSYVVISKCEIENRLLATYSTDGTVRIWNHHNGKCLHVLKGHQGPITSVKWCPDGSGMLATGSTDSTAKLWSVDMKGVKLLTTLEGHVDCLTDVIFDHYGGVLATTSKDCRACIWDAETGVMVHALDAHRKVVNTGEFSPLGRTFCTASDDAQAKVWDLMGDVEKPGECVHTLEWGEGMVNDVKFTPDGRFIVTVLRNPNGVPAHYRLLVWSAVSGRICRWYDGHQGMITSLDWHPCPEEEEPDTLVSSSFDGTVRLWEIKAEPTGAGSYLLQSDEFQGCHLESWEGPALDKQLEAEKMFKGALYCAAYSPDGKYVAAGGLDGHVRVYDSETLECLKDWNSHTDVVTDVAWSNDNSLLISSSKDTTARVWRI